MKDTFDSIGKVVDQQERHFTITLDQAKLSQVLREGLIYQADFSLEKPGGYQFRAVLRETSSGKLGTAAQLIQIPTSEKVNSLFPAFFSPARPALRANREPFASSQPAQR
ncbi:MAG: hypothetical protein ABI882_06030 [Acidobacteriota bacterium]